MNLGSFHVDEWVVRLDIALDRLEKTQEPYLTNYRVQNPRRHVPCDPNGAHSGDLLLDELRDLYATACFRRDSHYGKLAQALDPVRYVLLSHPAIEQVVGRTIGRDDFWVQILDSGGRTSLTDLIAGLMTRSTELSADRFRAAASGLNLLLTEGAETDPGELPTQLDDGCDAVLFWGIALSEPVKIGNGMAMLPYEDMQPFLDESQVEELAPPKSRFSEFRSVGAVVQSFRWKPQLRRTGQPLRTALPSPRAFVQAAVTLIDILSVAQSAPVLPLASFANRVHRSASLILGGAGNSGSHSIIRSAQAFDGLEECPALAPGDLCQARVAVANSGRGLFKNYVPVLARLTEALAKRGRFAHTDRFVPLAVALEQMYDIPKNDASRKLRDRVSKFLGTDARSREILEASVMKFYRERSASVHNRREKTTPRENQEAFAEGFDIARRTFFKLLESGPPENWGRI